MNLAVVVVGLLQASSWTVSPTTVTVGDTVYLTRLVVTDGVAQARVQPPDSTPGVESLTDPLVTYSEGIVRVRYAVAFFDTRPHGTVTPDIELVYPDGRLVRVPGDTVWVSVVSVLPTDDSLPPARPAMEPLGRRVKRAEPLVLLVGTTLIAGLGWGLWRRRTGPRPLWPIDGGAVSPVPFELWLGAGEPRAVAAAAAGHLRESIERADPAAGRQLSTGECVQMLAELHPDWPVDELADTLGAFDRARFAPSAASDLVDLTERAGRLAASLDRSGSGEV